MATYPDFTSDPEFQRRAMGYIKRRRDLLRLQEEITRLRDQLNRLIDVDLPDAKGRLNLCQKNLTLYLDQCAEQDQPT